MSQLSAPNPTRYGAPITLELARRVMAAAEAAANARGWPMAIAIVGSGGQTVMLHALDNVLHGSIDVSLEKARCAVAFRRPTRALEDAVAAAGLGLRLLAVPSVMPIEGGLPLAINGEVIGAIGVSGMQSHEDAQVAAAGVAALAD